MKNALFATTALVAAGFAGTAFAAEPLKASVHGYANIGIGYVDSDDDSADGFGVMRDGEVHVRAKGSSDNGLTFEFRFELEMFGATDQVDENWAAVSGSFGKILIGGNDNVHNELTAGVFYGPGAVVGYYDAITRLSRGTDPVTGVAHRDVYMGKSTGSDDLGIHYYSPNFSGFQAGISFQPDASCDGGSDSYYCDDDNDAAGDNMWSVGANYTGDFDGVRVSASAGYTSADSGPVAGAPDINIWSLGLELGAYGFGVGVFYEDNGESNGDTQDLAIGLKYSTGPWTVAGGFATLLDAPAGGDVNQFGAWATYSLMKGASLTAGIEMADYDAADDVTAGIVYLNLGF